MIYTLTLNPSLDYVVGVDELVVGKTHKTNHYNIYPGGKGINVSQILKRLGIDTVALGFVAGHTGETLESLLDDMGIENHFIHVRDGITRVNMKIRSYQGEGKHLTETDVNGVGPLIEADELQSMREMLYNLGEDDMVIISGSVPPAITPEDFSSVVSRLIQNKVCVVLDAIEEYMKESLKYGPFLIKPNQDELGDLFDVNIETKEDALKYARILQEKGAGNVLVSLGEKGAILVCEDGKVYEEKAPKGEVKNTVGAGDSMVAGFLAGLLDKNDMRYALKLGICAGSATAFSEGLASGEMITKLIGCV